MLLKCTFSFNIIHILKVLIYLCPEVCFCLCIVQMFTFKRQSYDEDLKRFKRTKFLNYYQVRVNIFRDNVYIFIQQPKTIKTTIYSL